MKKIILLILLIIFTTGCSYKELDELAIGNALGIDYIDDEYVLTIQVLSLKKQSENNENEEAVIYKGKGKTIATAIRNIALGYPKTLYFGHLELVILGESMLEQDLKETFDYFMRSPETRNDFDVLINPEGSAKEILEPAKEKSNSFPSKEIISTIENSMDRQGTTVKLNMEQFLSLELEKGINPVCTTIENINDEPHLTGMIALGDDKNYFKLSKKEAIAYNIINENFYDIVVTTKYDNEDFDLVVGAPRTDISMDFKNNKLNIKIKVELGSQISEVRQKLNLEDVKVQEKIEKAINKTIKSYLNDLIDSCKENNIDPIGFKNIIYKKYNEHYKEYKDKNICEIANIKIDVKTNVYRYGNVYRSAEGE